MLLFPPYSIQFCPQQGFKALLSSHCRSVVILHMGSGLESVGLRWHLLAKHSLPAGLCFEKQHTGVWSVAVNFTSVPLCMHLHMEGKGKTGIFYEDLSADIPLYRACKTLFPYNSKVVLRRTWALFLAKILLYFQAVSWLQGRTLSLSDHSYFIH